MVSKLVSLVKSFFGLIFGNKLKILSFFIFLSLFLIALFPFSDVSDLITGQISKATGNKVFLSFKELNLSLLPTPSIDLDGVKAIMAPYPTFNLKSLSISPSILGLLTLSPSASIEANGFLKSDLNLEYSQGKSVKEGMFEHEIDLDLKNLDLKEVDEIMTLPIRLLGLLNLKAELKVDPTYSTQPEGEFDINAKMIKIPSPTIPIPGFEITLPDIKFKRLLANGKISESNLVIDNFSAGEASDKLQIKIKGQSGVEFNSKGAAQLKKYNLRVQIIMDKDYSSELLFMDFLEDYKVKSGKRLTFQLKLSGNGIYSPPKMSKLGSF